MFGWSSCAEIRASCRKRCTALPSTERRLLKGVAATPTKEAPMSTRLRLAFVAAAALFGATPAFAGGKDRCRVEINGQWHWLPRTFTRGGCELEAKRRVCAVRCV